MKFLLKLALFLALLVGGFFLYINGVSGEFETVELIEQGPCSKIEGVPGAEDIDLHRQAGLAFISSDDRGAEALGRKRSGGLYTWDIGGDQPAELRTADDEDLRPHGISVVEAGGDADVYVVDHRADTHSVRVYHWNGLELQFRESHQDDLLISPNDVAGLSDGTFYVTNDHGSTGGIERAMEDFLRIGGGSVLYYDGTEFRTVAEGVKYANGIAVDEEQGLVYVASTTTGKILVYDRDKTSGALDLREEIETGTGVDNIDLDRYGHLWVAAHPKLLTFVRHASSPERRSPSEVLWISKESATDPRIRPIWRNLGEEISGSSVAVSVGGRFMVGSVFEPHVSVCERTF